MVKRCGFYTQDNKLCRKDVFIDWDLGFDKDAKHSYIESIRRELGEDLYPIVDVTTASNDSVARKLSPFFVLVDGISVEDMWAEIKESNLSICKVSGMFDFLYLNALSESQKDYVMSQKCFIDVFHNPDKAFNTQAKSLAVLQLLIMQNKEGLLDDCKLFIDWYKENCKL